MFSLDFVLQKAVKVDELVKEEEVPVKKRIAHEGARNYPPQVVATAKPLVNPMCVSCMASCYESVWRSFKISNKLKLEHILSQQDSCCFWSCAG
jgi:hypothetical protein